MIIFYSLSCLCVSGDKSRWVHSYSPLPTSDDQQSGVHQTAAAEA